LNCPKCGSPRAKFLQGREDLKTKKRIARQARRISREKRRGWKTRHATKVDKKALRSDYSAQCSSCGFKFDARDYYNVISQTKEIVPETKQEIKMKSEEEIS